MNITNISIRIAVVFAVFFVAVCVDATLIQCNDSFRDVLGRADPLAWRSRLTRLAPDLALLIFYASFFVIRRKRSGLMLAFVHSLIFLVLGLAAVVPWIGPFVAIATPMAVVYFAFILWIPGGWFGAALTAMLFAGLNGLIVVASLRHLRAGECRAVVCGA